MDSLIKLNTRNQLIVADRVIARIEPESRYDIDSISRIGKQIDLIYCLEEDFPSDSTTLYKKIRDFTSNHVLASKHHTPRNKHRSPLLYGNGANASLGWFLNGLRRMNGLSVISARTDASRSRIRGGYKLTDMAGGLGVLPDRGGKLMRAEDWSPNFFGTNSQLYLAGMLASRRMAKRFDFTAMGMFRV